MTSSSQFALYKLFVDAFMKGHPTLTRSTCHFNAQIEWNQIKANEALIKSHIEKYVSMSKTLQASSNGNEKKRTLSSDDEHEPVQVDLEAELVTPVEPTFTLRDASKPTEFNDENKPWVRLSLERARARAEAHLAKLEARRVARENRVKTPAQEAVIQEIKEISERIESLVQVKNMGLSTSESSRTLKKLLEQKKDRTGELSRLQSKQRAAMRYRQRKKRCVESICAADPEVASDLLRLYKPIALRVQIDNICPDLLQTFEEIARICGATEINPRLINVLPCSSLDELRDKIRERGYEIRRTSNFYRLIPARIFQEDGKRHVVSTAVRLRKIQSVERVTHEDGHYVNALLRHTRDLASTFGNECVLYLIEDRKASVRIGRPTTRGHSPLITHLDYQISSVDSTPIPSIASQQFKPIIYASCMIDENGLVGNAGPTYISIRSTKHDPFTMECQAADMDCLLKLREFEKTARNHLGAIKPIIIHNVDSLAPSDYTRFPRTLTSAIDKFKRYNLDALFVVAQAPGQTMYNVVERRLASLSQDLTGLVLPHDYFGTHLNLNGQTIDAELERSNLKKTGEVLAEIWSMDKIDGHAIVAEFLQSPSTTMDEQIRRVDCQLTLNSLIDEICDEEEEISLEERLRQTRTLCPPLPTAPEPRTKPFYNIDEYWCATHVFQTQYTIQIIRCTKTECCGPWRSNYIQVFPHRFLPPPVPFDRSSRGVRLAELETSLANRYDESPYYGSLYQRIQFHGIVMEKTENHLLPFDAYCPSIQARLHARVCSICKQYIPLAMRLRNHYRVHQQRYALTQQNLNEKKEDECIDEPDPTDPEDNLSRQFNLSQPAVFLFGDMNEWLKSDFEELPVVASKQKSTATIANAMIRKEQHAMLDATESIVESVATISLESALTSKDLPIPLRDIKRESLVVENDFPEPYDDLSDLLDQM